MVAHHNVGYCGVDSDYQVVKEALDFFTRIDVDFNETVSLNKPCATLKLSEKMFPIVCSRLTIGPNGTIYGVNHVCKIYGRKVS